MVGQVKLALAERPRSRSDVTPLRRPSVCTATPGSRYSACSSEDSPFLACGPSWLSLFSPERGAVPVPLQTKSHTIAALCVTGWVDVGGEDDRDPHTLYTIAIKGAEAVTCCMHRYTDFRLLHAALQKSLRLPSFPARKRLFHPAWVKNQRAQVLEAWLNELLAMGAGRLRPLLQFLGLRYSALLRPNPSERSPLTGAKR